MQPQSSSYDDVPYDSFALPQTQPDRLAVLAGLFSLETALPSRARVLEIGCAAGGNLIPLACRYPGAQFVGIDLSRRQIEDGRRDAAALGLGNVELREENLMNVDESFGRFDYIVAHGIYSWIPAEARTRLLHVFRENLSPVGVAYVSYNTYPGWGLRGVVRGMMRYHVSAITDPRQRAGEARALLEFLQTSLAGKTNAYANLLREESGFLGKTADSYLFHEHLEDENNPVYFHEFAGRAAAAGLQYLCEEEFASALPELFFAPDVAATVRRIARDLVGVEQYCDFLTNRAFRQSLLVGEGRTPQRTTDWNVFSGFHVASRSRPADAGASIASDAVQRYTSGVAMPLAVSNPVTKAALAILDQCWPQAVHFDALYSRARASLGKAAGDRSEVPLLAADLLRALSLRAAFLHREPLLATRTPSGRPVAFKPARYYASLGRKLLPNTTHETVRVNDMVSVLIQLLDGTRDEAALTDTMVDRVLGGKVNIREQGELITDPGRAREIMAKSVGESLILLRDGAFLVG